MTAFYLCVLLGFLLFLTRAGATSHLPFFDLGPQARVLDDVDDITSLVNLPSSFYIGNLTFNTSYVSSNGLISFGASYREWVPEPFPLSSAIVVAPFWDDIQLTETGVAQYNIITSANGSTIIDQVESFLKTNQSVELDLDWVIVAKWVNVCPYGNKFCTSIQPNTFQVVVASQGSISYAIFTYKCDLLRWTNHNAAVGYSAGPNFFKEHPLSRKENVTDIDCLNNPPSLWSNLVYKLSGEVVCEPSCVNGTCILDGVCQCFSGWTGPICNQVHCVPTCARGSCVGPNTCQCDPGWTGRSCRIDINECNDTSICGHYCNNTQGSYYCYCRDGFMLQNDGKTCQDINECTLPDRVCSHFCTNTNGSYYCSCRGGYTLTDNEDCLDNNECLSGNGGCQQVCVNTNGSYYCDCQTGYRLKSDNISCIDVDECRENRHNCSILEVCQNKVGGFHCNCKPEYQRNITTGNCEDKNECLTGNGGCSHLCHNHPGSFLCSCYGGYSLIDHFLCQDIDECSNDTLNKCEQICRNTPGNYTCDCHSGYILNNNQVTCKLQECERLYSPLNGTLACSNDTHVTNTTCITSCDVGYQLVGTSYRICLPNGSWSGERAYCSPLQCPDPIPPENGFIQLPCSNDYTTECNIRCFFRFERVGNEAIKCVLSKENNTTVMWTTSAVSCQRKLVCTNSTCKHGGKCIPISDDDFICNCTGTFYEGKTCDKGLIVTTDVTKLKLTIGQTYDFQVFAKPDKTLTVSPYISGKSACVVGSGIAVYFYPCNVPLTRDANSMKFSMIVFLPGLHFMTLSLSGENAKNFTQPAPMPIIAHSTSDSEYFKTFPHLQPSCYALKNDQPLQCGVLPELNPQLVSSCGWHKENDISCTLGIVYSKLNNVTFPVSVAGLNISNTGIKIPQGKYLCGNCEEMLMNIDKYPENKCYMYEPTGEDLREFVTRQSLSTAFVNEAQNKLLPSWIDLKVTPDSETLTKLSETDYKITLATTTDVTKTPGCESIIIDSVGQFGVLQHDGPLNLTLQTSRINYEDIYIPSPTRGSSVCIAVNLCLGENSPVYIGIPSSAQLSIQKISFIHDLILRGWNITFHSVTVHKIPTSFYFLMNFWNGVIPNYKPLSFQINLVFKIEVYGSFKHIPTWTEVSFCFVGYLSLNYDVENKVLQIYAFGKWTICITTLINGVKEKLTLSKMFTYSFIYYIKCENSTCSPQKSRSGIAIKVSFIPRKEEPFYRKLFQLPFDTPHCPVDVFIDLDSNKNMSGLSLYSDCLDILYNNLLFQKLAHRMYIPMATQTLCNQPTNFTAIFPDLQSFGLTIHSAIRDSSNSYLPLGTYFKLLQGYEGAAMSLAYSHSSATKVGLLYSVQVNIMDTSFITKMFLKNNELSFTGSGNLFNKDLYYANLHGKASVATSLWNELVLEINGWFPRFPKGFVDILQENVHKTIKEKAENAKERKTNADSQRFMSIKSFKLAKSSFKNAKQKFKDANNRYKESQKKVEIATTSLRLAEELLANKTDELKDAETALNTLCKIKVCPPQCVPATRTRTVYEDVYITVVGFCESICKVTEYIRVEPFFEPTTTWRFIYCCVKNESSCGDECVYEKDKCNWICKQVPAIRPVFTYFPVLVERPCYISCNKSVYNTTIEKTETYTDSCAETVPETTCSTKNKMCENERERVLNLIEQKRQGLTEPLRLRNQARRNLSRAETELMRTALKRMNEKQNLQAAQTQYNVAEKVNNASNENYLAILNIIKDDLKLLNLTENDNLTHIFNITNITFSVNMRTQSLIAFPINIIFDCSYLQQQFMFTTSYNFEEMQIDLLVDDIIDYILAKKESSPNNRRKRAEEKRDRQQQFEIHCAELTSINKFLQYLSQSLNDAMSLYQRLHQDITELLQNLANISNTTTDPTTLSVDYTSLKNLFNVTQDEIDQEPSVNLEDSVLDAILDTYDDIQRSIGDLLANLNQTVFRQWQNEIESSLLSNGAIGNRECYGFNDCLQVLIGLLDDLIIFGPPDLTSNIRSKFPSATKSLVMIALFQNLTIDNALNKISPVIDIVNNMNKTGYWCATLPTFITQPTVETNVSISGNLTLACLGQSSLPLTYQWRKDRILIPGANKPTLTVTNFQIFDEGNYTCDIINDVGTIRSTNASVQMFELPKFYLTPVSIITYIGDINGAHFTCNATSRPDPGWKWYHRATENSTWTEIPNEETNELLIRSPSRSHEGWYRCLVYNYHGNLSSDSVSLSLVTITAKLFASPIDFTMTVMNKSDNDDKKRNVLLNKREDMSIEDIILNAIKNAVDLGSVTIEQFRVEYNSDFEIIVHFLLVSMNTTVPTTGQLSLGYDVQRLVTAKEQLKQIENLLSDQFESNGLELMDCKSIYKYNDGSFTIRTPVIVCPQGQGLHPNRLLCVDCLEGQHQIQRTETRIIKDRTIVEVVPQCEDCPLNTYQNIAGGEKCIPCSQDHITYSTGTKSKDGCIAVCPINHYSPTGLAPCERCRKGTYQPEIGKSFCFPCRSDLDNLNCIISCPRNITNWTCSIDPCLSSTCSNYPDAQCIANFCGDCKKRFIYQRQDVTNVCSCTFNMVVIPCSRNCVPTCQNPKPNNCIKPIECVPTCGCPDGSVFDEKTQKCVELHKCDTCSLAANSGSCHGKYPRWFFNSTSSNCELFPYSGCDGNSNRFTTLEQCIDTCGCSSGKTSQNCTSNPCSTAQCPTFPSAACEVDKCTNNCSVRHFAQFKEVTEICDVCTLSVQTGPCNNSMNRWFFNSELGHCQKFLYGGCGGNRNNFNNLKECIQTCGSLCPSNVKKVSCLGDLCGTASCPNHPNSVCVSNSCGQCSARFYNSSGMDVTNTCTTCPPNKPPIICPINLCDYQTCPQYPNANCTVDRCGQCKAKFYVNQEDVTNQCGECPFEGEIFKPCGASCRQNCTSVLLNKQFICSPVCVPGCDCPAGHVLDETSKKCVYPDECPCPHCEPISQNCSNIINSSDDKCSCPICADCSIEGQVYKTNGTCSRTCTTLHLHCAIDNVPGCDCPAGQVLDETSKKCVYPDKCPCPPCEPISQNCSNIINSSDDKCSCPICADCSIEGQVYKTNGTCSRTCTTLHLHCTIDNVPGCDCPAGQVLDETSKKCVYPNECPCPPCEPISQNCSNIINSSDDKCSCPICADCSIEGQVYKTSGTCSRTCTTQFAIDNVPCCSCPNGKVIDEKNRCCVYPQDCPKPYPCNLPPYKGPCNGRILRYFYNTTSQKCEQFYYGGCLANENNFYSLSACEEKCSKCPPTCSLEYCTIKRGAICSIPSLRHSTCPGGCNVSNCLACYFSYNTLPLPKGAESCLANCTVIGQELDKSCMKMWGRCVRNLNTINNQIQPHERTSSNFHCWKYPRNMSS